jgi:hypothetical protein
MQKAGVGGGRWFAATRRGLGVAAVGSGAGQGEQNALHLTTGAESNQTMPHDTHLWPATYSLEPVPRTCLCLPHCLVCCQQLLLQPLELSLGSI